MTATNLFLLGIISVTIANEYNFVSHNNGVKVPKAYHSFAVIFVKKPGFDYEKYNVLVRAYYPAYSKMNEDHSYNGSPFISSGALLTRRWIMTRATPIAFYPVGSYDMVGDDVLSFDKFERHEIDFAIIHPEHFPGDHSTDIALVRTREELNFIPTLRSANLGFGNMKAHWKACSVVLWSWIEGKKRVERSERELEPRQSGCLSEHYSKDAYYFQFFICLTMVDFMPCMINNGAPVLCDGTVIGIYAGNGTGSWCVGKYHYSTQAALRVDQGPVRDWIEYILSGPVALETKVVDEKKSSPKMLDECPEPNGGGKKRNLILLTLFVIICTNVELLNFL